MSLTKREMEIIKMLCLTDKEIAHKLSIKKCTVKTHVRNLLNKLCEYKRINLLITAIKQGIIKLEDVITK